MTHVIAIASAILSVLTSEHLARPDMTHLLTPQSADFRGKWEFRVDDGTYEEQLELTSSGDRIHGTLSAYQHGYFSGRTTNAGSFRIDGSARDGRGAVTITDQSNGSTREMQISRRGAYLLLGNPGHIVGYARPGTALVQDASGSTEAKALARAIAGNMYQTSVQASGRGGFVGGRTRLALCANGEIAYDVSDVASVPGASAGSMNDMGSTMSRRGEWTIVLYAGAPAVMARWRGTGSSYSLTAYFDVQPAADGKSADVDGKRLMLAGRC